MASMKYKTTAGKTILSGFLIGATGGGIWAILTMHGTRSFFAAALACGVVGSLAMLGWSYRAKQ